MLNWPRRSKRLPIFLSGGQTYSQKVLGTNPLLYYICNDASGTTANDSGGNGYHGTYSGQALNQPGIGDGNLGLRSDGVNDYLVGPAGAMSALDTEEGSAMFWFRMFKAPSAVFDVIQIQNAGGDTFLHRINPDFSTAFTFYKGGPASSNIILAAGTYNLLEWNCAIISWSVSADRWRAWINGVEQFTTPPNPHTYAGGWGAIPNTMSFFGRNGGGYSFHGLGGHVALWNRPLLDSEVATLSASPGTPTGIDYMDNVFTVKPADLGLYFPMNELVTGVTEVKDASGNGYHHNSDPNPPIVGAGGMGDGSPSYEFVPADNPYTIGSGGAPAASWDGDEYSAVVWIKPRPGTWDNGTSKYIWRAVALATNVMHLYKHSVSTHVHHLRETTTGSNGWYGTWADPGGWVVLACTGSFANNRQYTYLNGVQSYSQAGMGANAWAGLPFAHIIGAINSAGGSAWDGWLSHFQFYKTELSAAEILQLSSY